MAFSERSARHRPTRRPDRGARGRACPQHELLHGVHPVCEALRARRRTLRRLWLAAGRHRSELDEVRALAETLDLPVEVLSPGGLPGAVGPYAKTQGVCLEAGPLPALDLTDLTRDAPSPRWIVAADGVQDPQNLGAIVRVAEAAGACGLVVPERRSAPFSPVASRASAGALEHLPAVRVGNLQKALNQLKKNRFWILGADATQGVNLYHAPERLLEGDLVLVLGAEGRGLRPGVRRAVDALLRIPMAGRVGSLNVAVAAAVVLFEWLRRARGVDPSPPPQEGRGA